MLLIGLPGSGKSTLAALLCAPPNAAKVISTDAIRAQLFGNEAIQGSWLKIWLEVRRQYQDAIAQIQAETIDFAIYDATNAVRKQRRQAIDLARKTGFTQVIGLWLNVPLSDCLERNARRGSLAAPSANRQVPEAIVLRMARRLYAAPPSCEEGLDQIIEIKNFDLNN